MKKIYFTLGLGVLFLGANAQQAAKINNGLTKNHSNKAVVAKGKKVKTTTSQSSTQTARTINGVASTMAAIWSDDFSSATTWTMTHASGTSSDWTIGTAPGAGMYSIGLIQSTTAANGFALFDSDNLCDGTHGQIANMTNVTPINLTGHSAVKLTFQQWYRRDADSTRIYVSNNGTTWTNFPINEEYVMNDQSTNPELIQLDISSVAANQATVWVRFTYYSPVGASNWSGGVDGPDDGCGYNWLVDDAAIADLPANDMTATSALAGSACGASAGVVILNLKNSGANAATGFPVKYTVGTNTVAVTETYTGTIAPGATATYTFTTPVSVVAGSAYNIVAYADITADGNVADDTAKTAFAATPYAIPYTTSFENTPATDVSGWYPTDVDGSGSTWNVDTQLPLTGTNELLVAEADTAIGDDWLFSPCLSLTAGGIYQVSYNVLVPTLNFATAGNLGIFLGTSPSPAAMTTTVSPTASITPGAPSVAGYNLMTATYTATTTGNFVFGFDATNPSGPAQLFMLLDDVSVTQIGTVGIKTLTNSVDLSIYPNPASGFLNITTTAATATVEMYNVMGQNVMSKSITNGTNTIDISNLATGVYSVQIMQNNTLSVAKIIKAN